MSALRSLLLSFGVEVNGQEKLDKVDSVVEGILDKVSKLGVGLASIFLVKQIGGFITDTIEAGRTLSLTAEKLGVTVDELERYRFAAQQAGVDTSFADRALMMFNRQVGEAEVGAKSAGKGLGQLGTGLSAAQISALPLQDLLGQIADKFAGMTDKSAKTQLAMKLFGRQGTALIPMLDQGAAGIKKWSDEFDELGGGIGDDFAQKAKDAGNETKKLEFVWKVLSTRLVGDVLPAVVKFTNFLTKVIVSLEWLQKHSYVAQTALIALGAAAAAAFAPFLIAIAPVVAGMTALYLVFDDIYTLMRGGDSLLGRFIDLLFGEGAHKTFVADVKKEFQNFIDWIKDEAVPWIKTMWHELGEAGKGPAIQAFRTLGDVVHALWNSLKGVAGALADIASGDWDKARKEINEAGAANWKLVTGGQDKSDEELNAEAKARAQMPVWKSMVDTTPAPQIPNTIARNPTADPNAPAGAGWNPASQKFDINVVVHAPGGDAEQIRKGVEQGVSDGITKADVKRAAQTLPWAPGMPIPKPGG